MSGDVVPIKPVKCEECSEPLVWVCLCGCTTWYARMDAILECAGCGNVSIDSPSGWRETLPDDQPGEVENTWKMIGGTHVEFWLKQHAKPGIRAAIIISAEGKSVTYTSGLSDEDRLALQAAVNRT